MYRRFRCVCRWIGVPAGMLAFAALACDGRQAPGKIYPAAAEQPFQIVSLSPDLSQLIVEFGLASQIVGADSASRAIPELASAMDLGEFAAVDVAAIASLQPDLVLALGEDDRTHFVGALRRRGFTVHVFGPITANGVIQSIHELGAIVGRDARARLAVRQLIQEISEIATERDGMRRLRVAWILQRDPLTVVGDRGLLHQILELAGGEIPFHQFQGERIEVSFEALAASEPDLVLDSTPQNRREPIAIGVRTEAIPTSISEIPTLDLLKRIRLIHARLYPAQ